MYLFRRLGAFLLDITQTIVLALSIFMLVYLFAAQPHEVRGSSMVPNFDNGEYILTDKISYRFGQPKRGDVVVFTAPTTGREDFIKRIVALPGETVSIQNGQFLVNDNLLEEAYLPQNFKTQPNVFIREGESITLAQDEYFVLGDNRSHSQDSRYFGPIKRRAIIGRAFFVYWPPQEMGLVPQTSYAGF